MAKDTELVQKGEGNPEGDAPIEAWDSIIGQVESSLASTQQKLSDLKKAAKQKKQPVDEGKVERLERVIEDYKTTLKIMKANRKRLFGA
jgi:cob(I)alamin adenosyltransferase